MVCHQRGYFSLLAREGARATRPSAPSRHPSSARCTPSRRVLPASGAGLLSSSPHFRCVATPPSGDATAAPCSAPSTNHHPSRPYFPWRAVRAARRLAGAARPRGGFPVAAPRHGCCLTQGTRSSPPPCRCLLLPPPRAYVPAQMHQRLVMTSVAFDEPIRSPAPSCRFPFRPSPSGAGPPAPVRARRCERAAQGLAPQSGLGGCGQLPRPHPLPPGSPARPSHPATRSSSCPQPISPLDALFFLGRVPRSKHGWRWRAPPQARAGRCERGLSRPPCGGWLTDALHQRRRRHSPDPPRPRHCPP